MNRLTMTVAIALVLAGPALAQDTVGRALANADVRYKGWKVEDTLRGSLDAGQVETFTKTLPKGDLALAGACDEDCANLNIRIKSRAGKVLAEETASGRASAVELKAIPAGGYSIDVTMAACTTTCGYGVRIFRK